MDQRIIEDASFIDLPQGGFVLYLELKDKSAGIDPIESQLDWDDVDFLINDLVGLKVHEVTEYLAKLKDVLRPE